MSMRSLACLSFALLFAAGTPGFAAEEKPAAKEKVRDKVALAEAREKTLLELQRDPKSLAQWKRLAMISRHLGDEKATEEALAKASALDPKDPGVNFMRGLLHEKREQRALAAASFRVCLEHAVQEKIKELCAKHLRRMEAP